MLFFFFRCQRIIYNGRLVFIQYKYEEYISGRLLFSQYFYTVTIHTLYMKANKLKDHTLNFNLLAFVINLLRYLLFESHSMYDNIRTNIN